MKGRILLVDDDEQITDVLTIVLETAGFGVQAFTQGGRALEWLRRERCDLILLDLRLGEVDGLTLFPRLRELAPNTPVFIITAHGDVDSAVRAFTLGVEGYVRKPFAQGELARQIAGAIEKSRIRLGILAESAPGAGRASDLRDRIRTRDPAMEPVLRRVVQAALVPSSVVITGESGTGKELVARALHREGPRRDGPFVAFNCAAVPESLLESEFFGYMRGAFTDARENKPGLFVRAHGGTLFLDEIGDASPATQAKLLRVLQEREVLPLGASAPVRIDVRVVAATHRQLSDEVAAGRFRQDLYFRLHVLPIHLPPLRDRPEDIDLLAAIFATRLAERQSKPFVGFTAAASAALRAHHWPGNVRELQNRIEQALAVGPGGRIARAELFPELMPLDAPFEDELPVLGPGTLSMPITRAVAGEEPLRSSPVKTASSAESIEPFSEAKRSFEQTYLRRVLRSARGNIAKAARLAAKSRTEVYSLLRKHDLDPEEFKR